MSTMPSLFRLLLVVATLGALVFGGLYVLATRYEPEQQMISKPVPNVKIRARRSLTRSFCDEVHDPIDLPAARHDSLGCARGPQPRREDSGHFGQR